MKLHRANQQRQCRAPEQKEKPKQPKKHITDSLVKINLCLTCDKEKCTGECDRVKRKYVN